VVENTHKH